MSARAETLSVCIYTLYYMSRDKRCGERERGLHSRCWMQCAWLHNGSRWHIERERESEAPESFSMKMQPPSRTLRIRQPYSSLELRIVLACIHLCLIVLSFLPRRVIQSRSLLLYCPRVDMRLNNRARVATTIQMLSIHSRVYSLVAHPSFQKIFL